MDPEPGNYLNSILLLSDLPWWPDLLGQFMFFILLIMASFTVSGAEVAFFSLTKAEIDDFRQNDTPRSQRIWNMVNRPKHLLATILIMNNFMNVAAILVASNILATFSKAFQWGEFVQFFLNIVVITSVLLFFGEIIPKVYAAKNRLRIVKNLAKPLDLLRKFLNPLSSTLISGTGFIDRRVQLKEVNASLEDLKHAIDLTTGSVADKEEKEILKGIVNFSNITVKSIMRARVDVIALEVNTPLEELIEFVNQENYSRLPVYEESLDHVLGVLHIKDLLPFLKKNSEPLNLKELLRDVYFIPESKKIDDLLEEFKTQKLHLAVVVDEFGGTAGIVTLEDVIEEIFGEITDEFDSEDWVYTKLSEKTYIFEGRISLIDVKKIVELDDQLFEDARGDSDSLGGLILELHGKIPTEGDIITYKNFELHVESVSNNRITMVKFVINDEEEEKTNA